MSTLKAKKILCSQPDCYNDVVIDTLTERMADGTVHSSATKCGSCTTPEDIKKLHAFRKRQSKKLRQKS